MGRGHSNGEKHASTSRRANDRAEGHSNGENLSATSILYGRLQTNSLDVDSVADQLEIDVSALRLDTCEYFENLQGYSGTSQWAVKSSVLPKTWKTGPPVAKTERVLHPDALRAINEYSTISAEELEAVQFTDRDQQDYFAVPTNSQIQMEAIEALTAEQGEWCAYESKDGNVSLLYVTENLHVLGDIIC